MNKVSEYQTLLSAARGLLQDKQQPISIYANVSALLKQTLTDVSWTGFYLYNGSALYLGPFQGKVACVDITLDRGVCGKAARDRKTVVVPNVHEFPGHIACSSLSKSEVVIPIRKNNLVIGVLDVDSHKLNDFDEEDVLYLEKLCNWLGTIL